MERQQGEIKPPKPVPPAVLEEGIPAELKGLDQWVLWDYVLKGNDWTKPPYRAKNNEPSTWDKYAAVISRYKGNGGFAGVGFVFSPDDPYCGIDLDECIDPQTDRPSDQAAAIISRLASYCEKSPSGRGVKLIVRARKPDGRCKFAFNAPGLKQVEVYDRLRYFTITGRRLEGTPAGVEDRQGVLDRLFACGFRADDGEEPPETTAALDELERQLKSGTFHGVATDEMSAERRAVLYLEKCPGAISGRGGHNTTFRIARVVVWELDLGAERGFQLLWTHYNPTCDPPWSERELRHKCEDADASNGYRKPRGCLLNADRGGRGKASEPEGRGVGKTPPAGPPPTAEQLDEVQVNAEPDDPHDLASHFLGLTDLWGRPRPDAGVPLLRRWQEEWVEWRNGAYRVVIEKDVRARVNRSIKEQFDCLYRVAWLNATPKERKKLLVLPVRSKLETDVLHAMAGLTLLPDTVEPPAWINREPPFPADEMLVTRNCLLRLPTFVNGNPADAVLPPTPDFFSFNALDFEFDWNPPEPAGWLDFLRRLWPDDPQSVTALQEWFGYCLTPDTSQHKILLLVGPTRSGKGVIMTILRSLVGKTNTAGPTLASLGTQFGLWPLMGKTLAVIGDARLSGKTDRSPITERLLTISGEDAITIDRKNMRPVTMRLPLRFAIVSNELPSLPDASGALAKRFFVLQTKQSWYGKENRRLTGQLLGELPGILLWAVKGWQDLRERGHFVQPNSTLDLVSDMEDSGSTVRVFARECCRTNPDASVGRQDLYRVWKCWCEERGYHPGTDSSFGRNLHAAFPSIQSGRPRTGGSRGRHYLGIALGADEADAGDVSN